MPNIGLFAFRNKIQCCYKTNTSVSRGGLWNMWHANQFQTQNRSQICVLVMMGWFQTVQICLDMVQRKNNELHFKFWKLLVLWKLSFPLCLGLRWLHLFHQMPVNHGKPRFCEPDWNKHVYTISIHKTKMGGLLYIQTRYFYLVTPPKTIAPATRPLQPSNQRPIMRFVAVFGTEEDVPASAVMVLWPRFTIHCRSCGLR